MRTNKFDCVEMKRKGARKVYEATERHDGCGGGRVLAQADQRGPSVARGGNCHQVRVQDRRTLAMKTKKAFDCVEIMHEGQAELQRKPDGMTAQEQREYWRRRTEDLRLQQQARIKHRHA